MQSQSSGQGSAMSFGSDPNQITQWLKGVRDPTILSHVAREVFGQIETLDQGERQQVYTQLRNDVKFNNAITNLNPQTA